jgi:hypothetical protein
MPSRSKRGTAARQVRLLDELRPVLRAEVSPERMLRAVAAVLARAGDYCIADAIDAHGRVRRVEIAHADPSRREKLRVAAQDTSHGHDGRIARLLRSGGAEIASKVTLSVASERLADIVLLRDERVRSYMAATVSVSGAPMAVLTIVTTRVASAHGTDDLAFLRVVADWTGLGLENALRGELQPRASMVPPAALDHPTLTKLTNLEAHGRSRR